MSSKSEENRKLSQDEIIINTKNVVRGLETLKNEHSGILKNLRAEISNGEANVKTDILKTSLEKIELGIGEAQVLMWFECFHMSVWYSFFVNFFRDWMSIIFIVR